MQISNHTTHHLGQSPTHWCEQQVGVSGPYNWTDLIVYYQKRFPAGGWRVRECEAA